MECLRGSHRGLLLYPPLDLVHSPPRSSRTQRTRSILPSRPPRCVASMRPVLFPSPVTSHELAEWQAQSRQTSSNHPALRSVLALFSEKCPKWYRLSSFLKVSLFACV